MASWVEASCARCWQVMETDDVTLLQAWIAGWSDLVSFEVVPVAPGSSTAEALAALEGGGANG